MLYVVYFHGYDSYGEHCKEFAASSTYNLLYISLFSYIYRVQHNGYLQSRL